VAPNPFEVVQEARRLDSLPRPQARAQLGDRAARTFLLNGGAFVAGLAFNAHLVSELRSLAQTHRRPQIWDMA
jgi:hypothetical protein